MRWAKTFEDDGSQSDTWSLYYLSDSDATGTDPKWTKVSDAQFGADGRMAIPATSNMTMTGLTVDGQSVGDVTLDFGTNALTQFADSNGAAKISKLRQNGYPAGDLTGVAVSEAGRLVASYSNGRTRELYEISLVSFSGEAWLERVNGGAFEVTPASGEPIAGANGSIVGKRLEASNTDIADEFSKLIVTQQAYSANTRIVSSSDQMLKEAINMIR
jgi:flagellar hook protein FlgE